MGALAAAARPGQGVADDTIMRRAHDSDNRRWPMGVPCALGGGGVAPSPDRSNPRAKWPTTVVP